MLAFSVQQSFHSTVCGNLGSLGLILCYYGNMLEAYPIRLAPSRAITLKARVRASYVKEDRSRRWRGEENSRSGYTLGWGQRIPRLWMVSTKGLNSVNMYWWRLALQFILNSGLLALWLHVWYKLQQTHMCRVWNWVELCFMPLVVKMHAGVAHLAGIKGWW